MSDNGIRSFTFTPADGELQASEKLAQAAVVMLSLIHI